MPLQVLRGVIICSTGLEIPERDSVRKRVSEMGGKYSGDFTKKVTHLVAGRIFNSEKYMVSLFLVHKLDQKAKELGMLVLKPSWIEELWERAQLGPIRVQDITEKHMCPIFHNLKACITEICIGERQMIAKTITDRGGRVVKELTSSCDVLITPKNPSGSSAKYEWARKWGIKVVTEEWIHSSLSSDRLAMSSSYEPSFPVPTEIPLSLTDLTDSMPPYLKKCKVYLCGNNCSKRTFESNRFDILRKLIVIAGGLRLNVFEPQECTHWIVMKQSISSEALADLKSAVQQNPNLFVVHDQWLVDCYKAGCKVDENTYQFSFEENDRGLENTALSNKSVIFRVPSQRRSLPQASTHVHANEERETQKSLVLGSQVQKTLGSKLSTVLMKVPNSQIKSELELQEAASRTVEALLRPLDGCIVAVSTRLWHKRSEFHALVTSLGGTFVYTLDQNCTHLLHTSVSSSDNLRDVCEARSFSIKIVSPDWILDCSQNNRKMPEENYPFAPLSQPNDALSQVHISQLHLHSLIAQVANFTSRMEPGTCSIVSPLSQDISSVQERYFCFTGLGEVEKKRGSKIISDLGGRQALLESPSWDARTTHLISGKPTRSEKYLAAMSSGAWILEFSYLEACEKVNSLNRINEEEYEVGRLSDRADIGSAGRRWRLALAPIKDVPPSRGAFTGWRVLLVSGDDRKRQEGFVRLLEAGGAVVFTLSDPILPDPAATTHLLLSSPSLRTRIKNDWLVHFDESKIHTTDYIAEFLMNPP